MSTADIPFYGRPIPVAIASSRLDGLERRQNRREWNEYGPQRCQVHRSVHFKILGAFLAKCAKYVVEVKFTGDSTPLNVANANLVGVG